MRITAGQPSLWLCFVGHQTHAVRRYNLKKTDSYLAYYCSCITVGVLMRGVGVVSPHVIMPPLIVILLVVAVRNEA